MQGFRLKTEIVMYDSAKEFCEAINIGADDLVLISNSMYKKYFQSFFKSANVVDYRKYGNGEPSDFMVEQIYSEVQDLHYNRVIAIGGGTILDVAKLFALKTMSPVVDLFEKKISPVKDKELILVPTTCGTGSEVTNVSILELTARNTKFGLADDTLFADKAVLIPELAESLPISVFSTSSIDALIHSVESYLSPKANEFTRMYSVMAIRKILSVYVAIASRGKDKTNEYMKEMLYASTWAGIAFGNAGCAAVHAMSYPLGAKFHVPHGEANYAMFLGVFRIYMKKKPMGGIHELNQIIANELGCEEQELYEELEKLLNQFIQHKSLHEYGMTEDDIETFTEIVMTKQGRLMANNYVVLTREEVKQIYKQLF